MRVTGATIGSLLFLLVVPGGVAGLVPWWLTGWHSAPPAVAGSGWRRGVGAVVIAAGAVSLLDSFARFVRTGHGTPAPVAPPTRLVVSGQYRHVRNPMYLAVVAVVVGQGLLLGRAVLFAYAVSLLALFHAFVVGYEEPRLADRFGDDYRHYRRQVRRWWPRTRPRKPLERPAPRGAATPPPEG